MRSPSFKFLAFSLTTDISSEKSKGPSKSFYPDFIQINLPTFIEYLEIWQTLKVQTRYLFLTLLGPPFDGSTIPYSTLLSFCSISWGKGCKAFIRISRPFTSMSDIAIWREIMSSKMMQYYSAKNNTKS